MARDGFCCILPVCIFCMLWIQPAVCFWSDWGEWSEGACSVSCGSGSSVVTRARFCTIPNNECPGKRVDQKIIQCQQNSRCGELDCYECNVFRSGKIFPCEEPQTLENCRACVKSYTRIRIHDRLGYTKDSVVESRMCVRQYEASTVKTEGCVRNTNNGGISIMCHCFSHRCNAGARQGSSLCLLLLVMFVWTLCQKLSFLP